MTSRAWQDLVRDPAAERHIVQIYRDRTFMLKAVTAWVAGPLRDGGGAVMVCTPANAASVLRRLADEGLDVDALRNAGRLKVVVAELLMSRFMVDGMPDGPAFKALAGDLFRSMRAACGRGEIRAWGEMVDVLAKQGDLNAAERLEALWNDVIDAEGLRLLCSYEADNLSAETHERVLRRFCAGHSQLVPEEDVDAFDLAVGRALVDVLGEDEAAAVRTSFGNRRTIPIGMPPAEAVLVALHATRPEVARRVFETTRAYLDGVATPAGT